MTETGHAPPRLAVQLYTFRRQLAEDADAVIRRIAELGFVGVEPVSPFALPPSMRREAAGWALEATQLKRLLDRHGLVVCSAHSSLPEDDHADAVLDEQELLGNDLLIVSSLGDLPGCHESDLDTLATLQRVARRFNDAAARAASRGMRIGYHNHHWEWNGSIGGRPGYDVFWQYLDPSIVAEVDLYWAQVAGRAPEQVIAGLGARAELVHVKDGPLEIGRPNTALGSGNADIAAPLAAGTHLRWHILEFDDCATDIFAAVAESVRWLLDRRLTVARTGAAA